MVTLVASCQDRSQPTSFRCDLSTIGRRAVTWKQAQPFCPPADGLSVVAGMSYFRSKEFSHFSFSIATFHLLPPLSKEFCYYHCNPTSSSIAYRLRQHLQSAGIYNGETCHFFAAIGRGRGRGRPDGTRANAQRGDPETVPAPLPARRPSGPNASPSRSVKS